MAGLASTSPPTTPLARPNPVALVTKDFARSTLSARHRPVLRALAEAMFSPDGEVPPERLDAFVEEVDGFISPASKTLRFGLVVMLVAIRWSPLLFLRFRTFDELTVDERVHHLERLERSKVKQLPLLVVAYKTVLSMIFYEDEQEQRAIGYPGAERRRWQTSLPVVQPRAALAAARDEVRS
ncbi:MAG: hypothetical protein KF894_23190 [Labilithrix sp.]|nr:hypothetical protein [Labilithrix sp.]